MGANRWALAALGLVLLLACARWQLGGISEFAGAQDLDFFDETQYLAAGANAHSLSDLKAQWAPPYCLWYRALFRLTGDTLATYHLNAWLLAFALPVLWYLLCVACSVRAWWALVSAVAWLVSTANLETLRVGNFAACIVLGSLIAGRVVNKPAWAWWCAVAGLSLAAYVRPELAVATVLVFAVAIWQLRASSRAVLAGWVAAAILPGLILALAFGLPFGGGRSGAAFQQHLAGNIVEWHGLPFSEWIHYEDVIRRYYSLPASAFDFLRQEPGAFVHHVFTNLLRLGRESMGLALRPADTLMDASRGLALWPVGLALLGALATRHRPHLAISPLSAVLVSCAALVLVSCAAIYPRAHYLPLLLCAALLLVAPRQAAELRDRWAVLSLIAIAVGFALVPRYVIAHATLPRPQEEVVRALRSHPVTPPLRLFDDSGVVHVYLNMPARRFGPRDFKPPFDEFLASREIGAVILSPQLAQDPLLAADESWRRFLATPEAFGFHCREVPATDRRVCVR